MNITAWLIVAVVFLLVGWDIYAAVKWGYNGTISRDILMAAYSHPIIPFAAGVLCGHLFWSQGGAPK
jgi:hypothetical protein